MKETRLNKYIADSGFASRRRADKLIEEGSVTVNGNVAKLGSKVGPKDVVMIDGKRVRPKAEKSVYLALHKPVGVISTLDPEAENSVLDYLPTDDRVFYVGRLDVASSGLMLFTNNGWVASQLTKSENEIEKEYVVKVEKKMTRKFLDGMRTGVVILGRKTKPASVRRVNDTTFKIIITEGRNRQIRRMAEKLGYKVVKLKRVRVANVKLGTLGAGNWRYLTKTERRVLLEGIER